MHNRDKHNNYWDHEFYLNNHRELEAEISDTREKIEENKKAITALKKEMVADQNRPSYTAHLRYPLED